MTLSFPFSFSLFGVSIMKLFLYYDDDDDDYVEKTFRYRKVHLSSVPFFYLFVCVMGETTFRQFKKEPWIYYKV